MGTVGCIIMCVYTLPYHCQLHHTTVGAIMLYTPCLSLPQAFSKVTHQEPEHGEAWANLSALWLQEGGWREALHAAEQAVKLKRESWQTWDNYALAASKAGAPTACVRGLAEVCCVFLCVGRRAGAGARAGVGRGLDERPGGEG